ncbi:Six-hairpin glycosidase-like protein [Lactifluus volemus]|nr:Six-hairpin glycosidase-like protein [Lactifluus volemus]
MFAKWFIVSYATHAARALPQSQATSATSPASAITGVLSHHAGDICGYPVAPLTATLPSQILQTVNLAELWSDPKTFVDKPTDSDQQSVLAAFAPINSTNATEAFAQVVHGYWTQLIRGTNSSALCDGVKCVSTLIPLNHTFVVPGGRFHYWDSFWIIEGLIQSQLFDIANDTLQNFMDEIETFGYIPNGGRIYYLNRSQPPMFIWMLANYVAASNDTSILHRALPLAEASRTDVVENNRSLNVTSPYTNTTYTLSRYAVTNSAPRPESYLTDYMTANDPTLGTPLDEPQRAELYSELASAAETGWDFSTRFVSRPLAGGTNNTGSALRSLNVKNHIPVDLNCILYKSNLILADIYSSGSHVNSTAAAQHTATAASIRAGILDLFWDPSKLAFYDFNLTSNSRNSFFSVATFYPLWRKHGAATLQRHLPNDLRSDGSPGQRIKRGDPQPPKGKSGFALVPEGQLGLQENDLLRQPTSNGKNASSTGSRADINALDGTFVNGGNATAGERWRDALARGLANRYFTSALCSWHSNRRVDPRLASETDGSAAERQPKHQQYGKRACSKKFSVLDIDSGGSGGEYTVQAGFGWTNGVVLWVASTFGGQLVAPECPDPLVEASILNSVGSQKNGAFPGRCPGSPVLSGLALLLATALKLLIM